MNQKRYLFECILPDKLNSKMGCFGLSAYTDMLFIVLFNLHFTSVILSECDFHIFTHLHVYFIN